MITPPDDARRSLAVIASVGGSPRPLAITIVEHRPSFVLFLCTNESVEQIPEIRRLIRELADGEDVAFADRKELIKDKDDLVGCFASARSCIQSVIDSGFPPDRLVVDYTGGTKSMSVALGLAAAVRQIPFSYVGGAERTKNGLGVVVDGAEVVFTGLNPFSLYAVEERRRIADLFNRYQFEAASHLASDVTTRTNLDPTLGESIAVLRQLADAYASWEKFQHKDAVNGLESAVERLDLLVKLANLAAYTAIKEHVEQNLGWLRELRRTSNGFTKPSAMMAADLLSNADRRACEGKYDDAVARLYRCVELIGQASVREAPLEIDSTSNVPAEKIPESLRADFVHRYTDTRGAKPKIKLGLVATFQLLAEVGHPRGLAYNEVRNALENNLMKRNDSILAHGLRPVERKDFDGLRDVVATFLGDVALASFPEIPSE